LKGQKTSCCYSRTAEKGYLLGNSFSKGLLACRDRMQLTGADLLRRL
jgi:hypothetical protein